MASTTSAADKRSSNSTIFRHTEDIIIDYEQDSYRQQTQEFLHHLPHYIQEYIISLFPIGTWIHRYNLQWLFRDLIAGLTVGVVVVPQSMGYAKIAELPPQYGLYTAFVGLCVYCLFATSKDISIGPTAVMSLLVGQTVTKITSDPLSTITGPQIAVALSLLTGAIAMFLGLVRLGILVDFIPGPAIAGFMTGSAITICIGQWPKLFGIKGVSTQDSSYLIFGNFFKHLPNTKLDVAFGLTGLLWLYGMRYGCQWLSRRYPKYATHLFFMSIMRNGILIIFATLIAFLMNIGKQTSPISILKTVPAGFQAMSVPHVTTDTISAVASSLPSGVIILILEHVAIAKSFGRINDYVINPNQEIIAIGFTNIWASFFGAYPSTGSFSRTAIKARSGVKTPLAGIFSGLVVVLALYALTPAFYYIPDSTLAAVVIHAVSDLVSGPKYMKKLAKVSVWELFVFVAGVIITFFTTVEYGIYVSVGLSIVILLFRIARPRFWGLGRIPLAAAAAGGGGGGGGGVTKEKSNDFGGAAAAVKEKHPLEKDAATPYLYVPHNHPSLRDLVEDLPAGILMCRVDESFTYPNSGFISDRIISYCKERTRRQQSSSAVLSQADRAWNDASNAEKDAERAALFPRLHALIIDFSSVNRLDSSGLQAIVDAQNALNRYSGHHVEFHFANILHPAIRRSLIVSGFANQPRAGLDSDGDPNDTLGAHDIEQEGAGIHDKESISAATATTQHREILPIVPASQDGPEYSHLNRRPSHYHQQKANDIEADMMISEHREVVHTHIDERVETDGKSGSSLKTVRSSIPLPRDKYPFFHWSCDEAVKAALSSLAYRPASDAASLPQQQTFSSGH